MLHIIKQYLTLYCMGRDKAVKREKLLGYCHMFDPTLTDRKLRKLVKEILEACCCERGYYIAVDKDDVEHSILYLKKKIFPLWDDIKRMQEAYPEYYAGEQMELPL